MRCRSAVGSSGNGSNERRAGPTRAGNERLRTSTLLPWKRTLSATGGRLARLAQVTFPAAGRRASEPETSAAATNAEEKCCASMLGREDERNTDRSGATEKAARIWVPLCSERAVSEPKRRALFASPRDPDQALPSPRNCHRDGGPRAHVDPRLGPETKRCSRGLTPDVREIAPRSRDDAENPPCARLATIHDNAHSHPTAADRRRRCNGGR